LETVDENMKDMLAPPLLMLARSTHTFAERFSASKHHASKAKATLDS
jgi:hypothetical protein